MKSTMILRHWLLASTLILPFSAAADAAAPNRLRGGITAALDAASSSSHGRRDLLQCEGSSPGYCGCENVNQSDYRGNVSTTIRGDTCQAWVSQSPHAHTRTPKNKPGKGLEGGHNYCRNPDGDSGGAWCYTTNSEHRWQYCCVPFCQPPTVSPTTMSPTTILPTTMSPTRSLTASPMTMSPTANLTASPTTMSLSSYISPYICYGDRTMKRVADDFELRQGDKINVCFVPKSTDVETLNVTSMVMKQLDNPMSFTVLAGGVVQSPGLSSLEYVNATSAFCTTEVLSRFFLDTSPKITIEGSTAINLQGNSKAQHGNAMDEEVQFSISVNLKH